MSERLKILVISGPTGSGKSAIALKLAQRFSGEIINADSVQVYKDFDIGSAKPDAETLSSCPHHLVSAIEPSDDFNAGLFCGRAHEVIASLSQRRVLPIVVGGTGLYIRSLLCGLAEIDEITEQTRQGLLERESSIRSLVDSEESFRLELFNWLKEIDPESADKLNWQDVTRVRRALLVKMSTGSSIATLQRQHRHEDRPYTALVVVLLPERKLLYGTLNSRVNKMLDAGLVQEVERLRSKFCATSRAFGAIGYKQVLEFLNGKVDYLQMVADIQQDTRHYAKRQFTWWANQPEKLGWKRWDTANDSANIESSVESFLQRSFLSQTSTRGNPSQSQDRAVGNRSAGSRAGGDDSEGEIFYLPVSGSGC